MSPRSLDTRTLPELERRLRSIRADSPPRWGGLNAPEMLCHLRATLELSLGERQVPRLVPEWIGAPIGLLLLYVFTRWPHGRKGRHPAIPALFPHPCAGLDAERERLLATMRRFVAGLHAEPRARARHPMLGKTTRKRWSRLHGVHFAHHLRQFGA